MSPEARECCPYTTFDCNPRPVNDDYVQFTVSPFAAIKHSIMKLMYFYSFISNGLNSIVDPMLSDA